MRSPLCSQGINGNLRRRSFCIASFCAHNMNCTERVSEFRFCRVPIRFATAKFTRDLASCMATVATSPHRLLRFLRRMLPHSAYGPLQKEHALRHHIYELLSRLMKREKPCSWTAHGARKHNNQLGFGAAFGALKQPK